MTKRLLDYGGKTPYDYTDENKTESFNWHHKLKKKNAGEYLCDLNMGTHMY